MSPEYNILSDNNTDDGDDDDTDAVVGETVITGEWFIAGPATAGAVTGSCVFSRQWIVAVVS